MSRVICGPHWWDVAEDADEVMARVDAAIDGGVRWVELTQLLPTDGGLLPVTVFLVAAEVISVRVGLPEHEPGEREEPDP